MGSMAGSVGQAISGSQLGQSISGSPMGGMQVSNQMYQPRSPQYDPYTASRRPNYMPYGPNQQFYQPIYRPSYGPGPFGGFYQQPQQNMFGPATDISDQGQADLRLRTPEGVSMHAPYDAPMLSPQPMQQQPMQQQYTPAPTQQANPVVRRIFKGNFSRAFGGQEPFNFPYSVNYGAPMLSPQPMQTQYRPIPYMTQTQIDAKAAADAAAAAPVNMGFSGDGAKAGGKVHGEGIDSLLRK